MAEFGETIVIGAPAPERDKGGRKRSVEHCWMGTPPGPRFVAHRPVCAADAAPSWRRHRPSGHRRAQTEHGEARQVLSGGEEVEVGVDFAVAAHAGASSAVFAAHEMTELAFHLGTSRPVVGRPFGVGLALAGPGEHLFVGTDANGAPTFGGGAVFGERAVRAMLVEMGHPAAVGSPVDVGGRARRADDGVIVEIDGELLLGEPAAGSVSELGLAHRLDTRLFQSGQELPGAISRIAVHGAPGVSLVAAGGLGPAPLEASLASGPSGLSATSPGCGLVVLVACRPTALATTTLGSRSRRRPLCRRPLRSGIFGLGVAMVVEEVVDQILSDAGIAGIAGRDGRVGDDLAVGIDRGMAFVAVKAPRRSLVTMTGLGVDSGDDPVLADPAGD